MYGVYFCSLCCTEYGSTGVLNYMYITVGYGFAIYPRFLDFRFNYVFFCFFISFLYVLS